jgi:acetyl-CoA acetyltransferase
VIKKSGPPSALKDVSAMAVQFDYSQVMLGGKTEQQWLAEQPPEDKKKYQDVKKTINDAFFSAIRNELPGIQINKAPADAPVTLQVQYTLIEQGKYAVVFAMDSKLQSNVAFRKGGQVTDKIHTKVVIDANVTQPSIHQRMGMAARELARRAAMYVRRAQQGQ